VILRNQVESLVVLLLVAAAVVALLFGEIVESAAIGVVLVLNTAIGFGMEWRAVRSMEALRSLGQVPATVRRSGRVRRISAQDLVPGDLVLLEEGDVITADLRLTTTSNLQVDESPLTGESVPVEKSEAAVAADTPLPDRASMVYKGTSVTRGSGEGVVVATGMDTELGAISALVAEADDDATPLEDRLDELGRSLVVVVIVLVAAIVAIGAASGRDAMLMVEMGIALAVAAIPEGLPVVATIALARGLRRMARRNALVRRLSSVETLGATSVICTDKTGTLTENRMSVEKLLLPDSDAAEGIGTVTLRADDEEEQASGTVSSDGAASGAGPAGGSLQLAAWVAALCTTAHLDPSNPDEVVGDPMEGALLRFGHRQGVPTDAEEAYPERHRIAFERATKMMASIRETGDGAVVAVKGAPEAVLDASATEIVPDGEDVFALLRNDRPQSLASDRREQWLAANQAMAAEGLRVLGLAAKPVSDAEGERLDAEAAYRDLAFVGLIGLVDPPREDVRASIQGCHRAGIRVVMVTGDQPETARYIARAVGLVDADDVPVVEGRDLESGDEKEAVDADIYARVTPEQKLTLIDRIQAGGSIVAMTGDGVNDAPALKSADIGVAMGRRGTQVAQEAADVVLQDDAFSTIVAAVEEGRTIFANIRAFVRFLLSCNVGEVMIVGTAAFAGLPLPILPLQILFLNLVTDVFPALALGMGEAERDVMSDPPRPKEEPVLTRRHWAGIAGYGALFTVSVLGVLFLAQGMLAFDATAAVTASFLTLAFGQLVHVFNMRSPGSGLVRNVVVQNPYVWGAVALCTALLVLSVYVPALAGVLSLTPLPTEGWMLVGAGSLFPLLVGQIVLWARGKSVGER
jgi:Ca2+-transporting ATPase